MSLKLAVFDMDGVLVDIDSSWRMVHRVLGVDNEENFRLYVCGGISFGEFMRSDISLWGRIGQDKIKGILDSVPVSSSAQDMVSELKKAGYKTAILSSGISILADRLRDVLGLDYSYANVLLVDEEGWLTGEGREVVELLHKDEALVRLADEAEVDVEQCVVFGDSRFDIPVFKRAGLSVAVDARDESVVEAADLVLRSKDLCEAVPWLVGKNLVKAEASLSCDSVREAVAVAKSVSPDNFVVPSDLQVRTWSVGRAVEVRVVCAKGVETMLATLDDVLACVQAADKTIKTAGFR